MEPDIVHLHSTSPPPLHDDDDGETGSEDDEFGGFSCSTFGLSDSKSPSNLRQPPSTMKPPNCSFNHTPEQSQSTHSGARRGQEAAERQHSTSQSSLHFLNGCSERDWNSGVQADCTAGAPREETGFADFTVFAEQAAHPWCCGFSALVSTEQRDVSAGGSTLLTNVDKKPCDSKPQVIMDSELSLCGSHESEESGCTKVKHCEKRQAANAQPSQDYHPPQDAAATLDFSSGNEQRQPGECRTEKDDGVSLGCLKMSDLEDVQTASVYDSATEDLPSFYDDASLEGLSEDFEPNASSMASQEDKTDWEGVTDGEEEVGNVSHADSWLHHSMTTEQSEAGSRFHRDQSATQEISATSNSESEKYSEDCFEHHQDQECAHTADEGGRCLGGLPPSDSFADFCSAPTQEEAEGSWEEFQDQRPPAVVKFWPQFRQDGCLQINGHTEKEQDRTELCGVAAMDSCQASLSCRVQQLLQTSFPAAPAVESEEEEEDDEEEEEEEEEVLSLDALLHAGLLPESGSEEMPELTRPIAQWVQQGMWFLQLDVHSTAGLQFRWGGSHANKALLRCLGVDSGNTAFFGVKKQPAVVPACASSPGMLEPTKETVSTVCSSFFTTRGPPGPQVIPDLSTDSVQEALPSSPLDWINRGLSSSQGGASPRRAPYFWAWR